FLRQNLDEQARYELATKYGYGYLGVCNNSTEALHRCTNNPSLTNLPSDVLTSFPLLRHPELPSLRMGCGELRLPNDAFRRSSPRKLLPRILKMIPQDGFKDPLLSQQLSDGMIRLG